MFRQLYKFFPLIICLIAASAFSQKSIVIKLDNPSFEDFPQAARAPQGWFDCGFASETPPDIQPNGSFQVTKTAEHGSTYLGMVVRDNNTWEAIGQKLKTPLVKGAAYTFSLFASRSELYVSQSKTSNKELNYTTPVVVRIWGGSGYCSKDEMLDETEPITNGAWEKKTFKFTPKSNHTHFMIEAFFKTPTLFPYNGNILLDNSSDIAPEEKEKIAAVVMVKPKNPAPPKPVVKPTPPKIVKQKDTQAVASVNKPVKINQKPPPKPVEPPPAAENTKLQEGQIIKIEKLQFAPNSVVITPESHPQLDKIYEFLNQNPNLVVEIGGHTNLVITDDAMSLKLSTERAKAVAEYLVGKGIDRQRLVAKGYGKSKPVVQGSSADANKINQRVEIKILSTNG